MIFTKKIVPEIIQIICNFTAFVALPARQLRGAQGRRLRQLWPPAVGPAARPGTET